MINRKLLLYALAIFCFFGWTGFTFYPDQLLPLLANTTISGAAASAIIVTPAAANPQCLSAFTLAEGRQIVAGAEVSDGYRLPESGWLLATAEADGIFLTLPGEPTPRLLPYPADGSPGRDILPWIIQPWQITFSPSGQHLLFITMEGYPDQYADYFRLWVLDLKGQEVASLHGAGLSRAWWLDDGTIGYLDFTETEQKAGSLYFWRWAEDHQVPADESSNKPAAWD